MRWKAMARQIDRDGLQVGVGMAADREGTAGLERAAIAFQADVLMPLLAASLHHPEDVRHLIESFRERLEALDLLLHAPSPAVGAVNGARLGIDDERLARTPTAAAIRDEDIGRNQKSRVREMTMLDILAAEARPFSLPQLVRALEERGFDDGQAAIVSQLHRMKKVGLIEQPGNGMYEIREAGLAHLRKLKSSIGALIKATSR
jgi:hypothetical protein